MKAPKAPPPTSRDAQADLFSETIGVLGGPLGAAAA